MLKSLKLRKLKEKYEMHFDAACFCYSQQLKMFKNLEFLTDSGEEKWQNYAHRVNIHMSAYEKLLNDYNELIYAK